MLMKAIQVKRAGGPLELVELPVPQPAAGMVRIKVEACGICHSDMFVKDGLMPVDFPRVPGHEVVGRIDHVGSGVDAWRPGDRVGVGWHGGHCFTCEPCRRGDFVNCREAKVAGLSYDGGYAEYMVAPQEAVARVPVELESTEAAPLLCAGITTFNALRNSGAGPGDLVAVQGIGGLGHLGVQFANKMGFRTAAVSHGSEKAALARELGAHHYIDATGQDPAAELQKLGGARVVLATSPDSASISPLVNGLGVNGKLLIVGVGGEPLAISPLQLIPGRRSVQGWPSGSALDSEETMSFSALAGIRARIETFPLAKAAEAYERMLANKARFRIVLVP